jgi:transposase
MGTKDFRSLSSEAQEELRIRAVKAVLSGKTRVEAALIFGVTRESVGAWVKRYAEDGRKGIEGQRRGRPRGGSLLPWQAAQVVYIIRDKRPDQLKLPFYLWTREAVAQLIGKKFGISLSVWTVGRYLALWGFTPQKPIRRAFEQDDEAVRQWLQEKYPAIRKHAKREKAEIYWGDEMGLRSDHAAGRTYSLRGQTPVVPGTGRRFGCNMISAITNRGRLNFMVFKESFRVDVFLDFLKRLVRQAKRKVFLVVDGHPVHRAAKAKRWLKENERRIRLFYLPGYSPELNPDEMLNQDVKSNAVGRKRASDQDELIANVRGYLRSRQKKPHVVKNYFNEKHVRYAAV